jgi:transcriptional regulator with XRE-family HTH domain
MRQQPRWIEWAADHEFRPALYRRMVARSMHRFTRLLVRLCLRDRVTLEALARKSGFSPRTFSAWTQNNRTARSPQLENMEAALALFGLRLIAVPETWLNKRGRYEDAAVLTVAGLKAVYQRAQGLRVIGEEETCPTSCDSASTTATWPATPTGSKSGRAR